MSFRAISDWLARHPMAGDSLVVAVLAVPILLGTASLQPASEGEWL